MKFTLRQMAVFAGVARGDNVSRAAETLNLSQSAASAALAELERQFDQPLFDRVGKRLRLNDRGRQVLPLAIELLDRATEIESMLRSDSAPGNLRIGATLTIGNYLATLIVAEFLQLYPDAQVQLLVHNTATVIEQVACHDIDLGMIEGVCVHPDVESETWVEDELVVFCAPHHPLARSTAVLLDQLAAQPWILREQGSGTRETLEQALRLRHSRLNVRLELEHTEAVKRAVECGLGVGCISRLALRDAFRRGSLVPLVTPELDLRRQFQFVWHRGKYQSRAMQLFLERCRKLTAGVSRSDEIVLPVIA
ncbi:MAG: LysR family transcriptional regulator [Rhodocyclales bacterium]|nr:LysR family transcriptional regulator [Rhodocyclales bacterium]